MKKPLDGIRIIETGRSEAAGAAGLMLSDFGAEVILIDPPGGYPDAQNLSQEDMITFGTASDAERLCDRGKKRVFLDLSDKAQKQLFLKLLLTADALLDGTVPGDPESTTLLDGNLKNAFPDLTIVSVSGFGRSGPLALRKWSEGVVQAESGFMSTTGPENGDPVRSGGDMANFLGGMITCIAVLMSLAEKAKAKAEGKRAEGRKADVSMMDSILFGLENQFSLYLKSGIVPRPKGNHYALSAPVGNYPCKDGEIMISVATEAQWQAFSEVLGHPEWVERPEFLNVSRRIQNYELLGQVVSEAFSSYTRAELMEILQQRNCIYGCINDFEEVTAHVQTAARKMFMEVKASDGTRFKAPANPILIDGIRMQEDEIGRPGADTKDILGTL